MSVGGQIIEVALIRPDRVRLWVVDRFDEVAVLTAPANDLPKLGDTIWWQSGKIYWTDKARTFVDRELPKLGFSFDPRQEL